MSQYAHNNYGLGFNVTLRAVEDSLQAQRMEQFLNHAYQNMTQELRTDLNNHLTSATAWYLTRSADQIQMQNTPIWIDDAEDPVGYTTFTTNTAGWRTWLHGSATEAAPIEKDPIWRDLI